MMYCKYCGAVLDEGAIFCASCGATANASNERVEPKAAQPEEGMAKREKGDLSFNKGANYYTYDNSIIDNKSDAINYTQVRTSYKDVPIQYTENFSNVGGFQGGNKGKSFDQSKPLKIYQKIMITVVSLAIGGVIGYLVGSIIF